MIFLYVYISERITTSLLMKPNQDLQLSGPALKISPSVSDSVCSKHRMSPLSRYQERCTIEMLDNDSKKGNIVQ